MERYETFRQEGWKSLPEGNAKVISYFVKRNSTDPPVTVREHKPTVEALVKPYDRLYDITLVIRLMKDKMFTQKLTRVSKGVKRRITLRKDFLAMKPWDVYDWVSLQEEVRFAVRNDIDEILLCKKEVDMIS